MIANSLQLCADRFSDRKDGLPDRPAAHILSGAITGDSIMKHIPLTQGKVAIVDDADYEWLNQWKWCAVKKKSGIFYASRGQGKATIAMHRQILNIPEGAQADHRNHDGLDNRKCNLRLCTPAENQWNQKPRKGISKYKGVCLLRGKTHKGKQYKDKWRAYIKKNQKTRWLGCFQNEIDAAEAYDKAAKELFGEFAYTNFRS